MTGGFSGPDFTGDLDRAAEPQQLFRQRGFAGVGVGNDGESTATGNFVGELGHGSRVGKRRGADYPVKGWLPRISAAAGG